MTEEPPIMSCSSSSINCFLEDSCKECSNLAKGYFYEMELQKTLENLDITYTGNPKQFEEWKKYTNTGFDIKVFHKENWISIEAKFTLVPIAHSWFIRDWLSRTATIFVTNNKYNISYNDRRVLEQQHRRLLSTTEFIVYLSKLMERGNKYLLECTGNRSLSKYIIGALTDILTKLKQKAKLLKVILPNSSKIRLDTLIKNLMKEVTKTSLINTKNPVHLTFLDQ